MTYSANDKNLAAVAKVLPREAMAVWCNAANEAAELGLEHNDAVRAGWAEVGKTWHRPDGRGRYVRKDSPGAGDVHVDVPMGGKPKKKPFPGAAKPFEAKKFETSAQVCKVDDGLGLVFGYAIVCTEGGEPYFDHQSDHIPEDAMLKAAADFMLNSRAGCDMHERDDNGAVVKNGEIVFAWPMTTDIAAAIGATVAKTGLLIAYRPADPAILAKFRSGEYTGFSIGGTRITDEEVD